eukprot:m51a1_g4547 putative transforming growth factor beta-1-induced transcript 1 protein isoform x2 (239) ;mRNA; r:63289-64102
MSATDLASLDDMLSGMSSKLQSALRGEPVASGTCAACGSPIVTSAVSAMGKLWHQEHFVCVACKATLVGGVYRVDADGQPRCDDCWRAARPVCGGCLRAIEGDQTIEAAGKHWHPTCFCCTKCKKQLADGSYYAQAGFPYCEEDYYMIHKRCCAGCGKVVLGHCLTACGKVWHDEHFKCDACGVVLASGEFFEHRGKPFCADDYAKASGEQCASCGKLIIGQCSVANGKKYHPEHYTQ